MTVRAKSDHPADSRKVIPDALTHADAVCALVTRGGGFEVVVQTVQPTDEGVVQTGPCLSEFSVTEINAAVMTDADEGALP